MTAHGYRVELDILRAGERGLHELSDELGGSTGEPLGPPANGNRGFSSAQAMVVVTDAWEAEVGELATVLRVTGDKLAQTAAEYDRADCRGAHDFHRILHGG